jgi:hypothetical protein
MTKTVLLVAALLLGSTASVKAQVAASPLPAWHAALPSAPANQSWAWESAAARSNTKTGLLVGGIIGLAATTVFLIGFCSDPDTVCGIDEVGRAVLFIAVPVAAAGALIGSLIHSEP